jgi:hypothetical protein
MDANFPKGMEKDITQRSMGFPPLPARWQYGPAPCFSCCLAMRVNSRTNPEINCGPLTPPRPM